MKLKAFTLAEAMVMIAVLGVITAVALPTIVKKDFKTETNVRAASKAYAALAQVVSNVVQDGYYYKKFDKDGLADATEGIDVLTGKKYNANNNGTAFGKFSAILKDSLYARAHTNNSNIFDTPDGIRWKLVSDNNAFSDLNSPLKVYIDTNIKNGTDFACNSPKVCKEVDSLLLLVYRNGNVVIDGIVDNVQYYNNEDFVRKILGQHEDTTDKSYYYK